MFGTAEVKMKSIPFGFWVRGIFESRLYALRVASSVVFSRIIDRVLFRMSDSD